MHNCALCHPAAGLLACMRHWTGRGRYCLAGFINHTESPTRTDLGTLDQRQFCPWFQFRQIRGQNIWNNRDNVNRDTGGIRCNHRANCHYVAGYTRHRQLWRLTNQGNMVSGNLWGLEPETRGFTRQHPDTKRFEMPYGAGWYAKPCLSSSEAKHRRYLVQVPVKSRCLRVKPKRAGRVNVRLYL